MLICSKLSCIDQRNQLLMITNTININTILAAIKLYCIFAWLLFTVCVNSISYLYNLIIEVLIDKLVIKTKYPKK